MTSLSGPELRAGADILNNSLIAAQSKVPAPGLTGSDRVRPGRSIHPGNHTGWPRGV